MQLSAAVPWSRKDLDQIARHVLRKGCVHLTIAVPHRGVLTVARRHGIGSPATDVRDRLADLARAVGPDASRVMVRIQHEPGALKRWSEASARRLGMGKSGHAHPRERALDKVFVSATPHPAATVAYRRNRRCEGRSHVHADSEVPLSWDVVDQLDRAVSAGDEAHLVLTVPRSPVARDAGLHLLWQRRMALDVADRSKEVAQMWSGSPLVRIDVVTARTAAGRVGCRRWYARRTP